MISFVNPVSSSFSFSLTPSPSFFNVCVIFFFFKPSLGGVSFSLVLGSTQRQGPRCRLQPIKTRSRQRSRTQGVAGPAKSPAKSAHFCLLIRSAAPVPTRLRLLADNMSCHFFEVTCPKPSWPWSLLPCPPDLRLTGSQARWSPCPPVRYICR